MTAATLTLKTPAAPIAREAPAKTKSKPQTERKSWFARFLDTLIEARMRQAQREIEHYLVTTAPEDLREKYAGKFGQYDDIGVRFMR